MTGMIGLLVLFLSLAPRPSGLYAKIALAAFGSGDAGFAVEVTHPGEAEFFVRTLWPERVLASSGALPPHLRFRLTVRGDEGIAHRIGERQPSRFADFRSPSRATLWRGEQARIYFAEAGRARIEVRSSAANLVRAEATRATPVLLVVEGRRPGHPGSVTALRTATIVELQTLASAKNDGAGK